MRKPLDPVQLAHIPLANARLTRHDPVQQPEPPPGEPSHVTRRAHSGHRLIWALVLASIASPVHALRLQVRSRTQLVVTAAAAGSDLEVRGQVRDARQAPVAGAVVALVVAGSPPPAELHKNRVEQAVVTRADGSFVARFPLEPWLGADRLAHVEAKFPGTPDLGDAAAEVLLDLQKQDATIDVHVAPLHVRTDAGDVELTADVHAGDVPLSGVEVQWLQDGVQFLVSRTDGTGRATGVLPGGAMGEPGVHRLTGRVPGDGQINGAEASASVELEAAVRVAMTSTTGDQPTACATGGTVLGSTDWCVQGKVERARRGAWEPIAQTAVTLHIDRHQLAALPTDADGKFAAVVRADALSQLFPPGAVGLVARAQVTAPWHEVGWSPVLSLEVPAPPSLAGWFYGLSVALLVAGALWQRWRARQKERALEAWWEASSAGLPDAQVRSVAAGEPSCRLRGRILHGETGRPTAADLRLTTLDGPERVVEYALSDGHFDVADLAPGNYRCEVMLAEHVPLVLTITLPHDGLYDQCELLPASCRAVVRGAFNQSVRTWTQKPVDWTRESPRDVEPRLVAAVRRGHGDLREAVRRVERALYGRHTATADSEAARAALQRVEDGQ